LVNSKFEKKFIETLTMIRENAPELKNLTEGLFKDSDFEDDEAKEASNKDNTKGVAKKDKPVTYKDLIRKDILDKNEGSSSNEDEESDS
jgi:hypothetical protein